MKTPRRRPPKKLPPSNFTPAEKEKVQTTLTQMEDIFPPPPAKKVSPEASKPPRHVSIGAKQLLVENLWRILMIQRKPSTKTLVVMRNLSKIILNLKMELRLR